jgi:predicted nucleic acid-binding protein
MVTRVLDTNVIAKWFFEEEGSPRAEKFLQELEEGQTRIVVPASLHYELANVFWVRRREGLSEQGASDAWAEFVRLPIELRGEPGLIAEAIGFSFQQQVSPYDAVFVVLARELGCELITADIPLYSRVRGLVPGSSFSDAYRTAIATPATTRPAPRQIRSVNGSPSQTVPMRTATTGVA